MPGWMLGLGCGRCAPAGEVRLSYLTLQKFGLLNDGNIQMLIRRVEMTLFLPSWISFQDFVVI